MCQQRWTSAVCSKSPIAAVRLLSRQRLLVLLLLALICTGFMYFMFFAVDKEATNSRLKTAERNQQPGNIDDGNEYRPKLIYRGEFQQQMNEKMTSHEADGVYWSFLYHLHYVCEDYVRLGKVVDGGWDICVVPPYQLSRPCLVYSFGINYDFSFDDAVSNKFGCTVRAFDPSMDKAKEHRRDANIWFYKLGIGAADTNTSTGWTVKTLASIVNMLNDTGKTIDYLKMDVEEAEWSTLTQMFQTDVLSRVKQLGIEIHTLDKRTDTSSVYARWTILRRLETFGFRRWYWHFNHDGAFSFGGRVRTCCYELVYVNVRFMATADLPDSMRNDSIIIGPSN